MFVLCTQHRASGCTAYTQYIDKLIASAVLWASKWHGHMVEDSQLNEQLLKDTLQRRECWIWQPSEGSSVAVSVRVKMSAHTRRLRLSLSSTLTILRRLQRWKKKVDVRDLVDAWIMNELSRMAPRSRTRSVGCMTVWLTDTETSMLQGGWGKVRILSEYLLVMRWTGYLVNSEN